MSQIVVFDLDGTLALGEHREHHLAETPKNWGAYFAACGQDAPNLPIITIFNQFRLSSRFTPEIWTGRIDTYYDQTEDWLVKYVGAVPNIRMREAEDRTQDDELKRSWLAETRAEGHEVVLAFEDRARVVEMWRAEGVVCCQVAKGDF